MRIAIFDDGISYDGTTAETQALGGVERAVIALARAFSGLGHEVTVLNRCPGEQVIDGVHWRPLPEDWASEPPLAATDALIAVRDPALLAGAAEAGARVLWALAAPAYLGTASARGVLQVLRPALVVPSLASYNALPVGGATVIVPGVEAVFHPDPAGVPADPPVAVVTTHPAHGLAELLDLWRLMIHPAVPTARLHIYSSVLYRGLTAALPLPPALRTVADSALALAARGVEVRAPLPAAGMARVYREARVHLYPGHAQDMVGWTLADSQACGLPAVARMRGAAGERLVNGQTGYLVPDDEALANVAIQLLSHEGMWRVQAEEAARPERRRSWEAVARAFERLMM
ncbi:glycosyltransferase [Pararhodospirillum photometricum]|nr:glycosyltransferase [Pararhodospirillum photometricum]